MHVARLAFDTNLYFIIHVMVASEKERLEMRLQLAQSSSKKKSKNKREPSSSGGSPWKSSSRRRAGKENKTDKVKDAAKVASKRKTTVQYVHM